MQNRALKFAYDIRYPSVPTAKSLHERAKMPPLNQNIYKGAKEMWRKIEAGDAADVDTFNNIININITNPHFYFPSSYDRVQKDLPPPIYTAEDCASQITKLYYR